MSKQESGVIKLNLSQQEYIDNNSVKVEKLAEEFWDANNRIDYDPMHPKWCDLNGPIKDNYIAAASYIVLANETNLL